MRNVEGKPLCQGDEKPEERHGWRSPQAIGERGGAVAQTVPPSSRPPRRPALYGLTVQRGKGDVGGNGCKALRISGRFYEIDVNDKCCAFLMAKRGGRRLPGPFVRARAGLRSERIGVGLSPHT